MSTNPRTRPNPTPQQLELGIRTQRRRPRDRVPRQEVRQVIAKLLDWLEADDAGRRKAG